MSQIGRYPGARLGAGWVFKVNGASPPVGADQVELKDGDEVLWYYATFGATGGPPTLALKAAGGQLLHGLVLRRRRQVVARRRRAQVQVDGRRVKAGANGRGLRRAGTSASCARTPSAPSGRTP